MKVLITKRTPIKAKNGTEYALYKGISKSGDTVDVFLTLEQEKLYGISDANVVDVTDMLEGQELIEIDFNNKGRIDSITL